MSFNGQISGSLAPQGAKQGNLSGNIGAVTPAIRDGAVTTAKIADAAVTIAKLAQDVTALINSKGDASDVAQLQEDVEALQTITAGLGTASTYGVANNLTQSASGVNVLDAAQGKVLGDRVTTNESAISTLNDGYAQLGCTYTLHTNTSGMVKESWKWNDGTLICTVRHLATIEVASQSGGIYYGILNAEQWPVAFIKKPTCSFNTSGSSAGSGNCWCWGAIDASATYTPQLFVGRGTSAAANVWAHYTGIGRWK